jgi:hypothetical protein
MICPSHRISLPGYERGTIVFQDSISGPTKGICMMIRKISSELFNGYESINKPGVFADNRQPYIWDIFINLMNQSFIRNKFGEALHKADDQWTMRCREVGYIPNQQEHFHKLLHSLP